MSGVQFMHKGEVVATDIPGLREWIGANKRDDFEFWVDTQVEDSVFNTFIVRPSDIIRALGDGEYDTEMAYWMDGFVPLDGHYDEGELGTLGISVVEVLPPMYTVEPIIEPWQVGAPEVYGYYDEADSMKVGDVYANSAYRVVRTRNRAPGGRFRR